MDAPQVPEHGGGGPLDALKHRYHGVPGYAIAGVAIALVVVVAKMKGGSSSSGVGVNPLSLVPNGSGLDGGGGGGGTGDSFAGGTLIGTTIPDGGFDSTPSTPLDSGGGGGGSTGATVQPAADATPVPTASPFTIAGGLDPAIATAVTAHEAAAQANAVAPAPYAPFGDTSVTLASSPAQAALAAGRAPAGGF